MRIWGILLVLCRIRSRVTLKDLLDLQKVELEARNGCIVGVNPLGPLNLVRGYLYHENGLIHNKRFFSPEIDTEYSLSPCTVQNEKKKKEKHIYEREPVKDKCRRACSSTEIKEYAEQYHSALIMMFPSPNANIGIEVGRDNSFTRFLRQGCTKKQANYILASLLLLSEGIDIYICCTEGLVTLKKKYNGEELLSVSTKIISNSGEGKKTASPQKQAASVINFIKKWQKTHSEPSSLEEFKTGDFLNSTQFLVHSYIFEYIDEKTDAAEIIQCAHELLGDALQCATEQKAVRGAKKGRVFSMDRFFIPKEDAKKKGVFLEELKKIEVSMRKYARLPFSNSSQMPEYKQIPMHTGKEGMQETDVKKAFSNCVETCIYTMFCCLAYNPDKARYSLDKVPNAKGPLKSFFGNHTAPDGRTSISTHQEWNAVVSRLPCKEIIYRRKEKNELITDALNIMQVITYITGRLEKKEEKARMNMLLERVRTKNIKDTSLCKDITEYVVETLQVLSVNPCIEVFCEHLSIEKDTKSSSMVVLGKIILKCKFKGITQSMVISLKNGHAGCALVPKSIDIKEEEKTALEKTRSVYAKSSAFAEMLFLQYIENIWIKSEYEPKEVIGPEVNSILDAAMQRSLPSINRLFMMKELQHDSFRRNLCAHIPMYGREKGFSATKESPVTWLVSNFLGSLPLDDDSIEKSVLSVFIFTNQLKTLYSRINLSEQKYLELLEGSFFTGCAAVNNAKYTQYLPVVLERIAGYAEEERKPLKTCFAINDPRSITFLFDCLFRDATLEHANKLNAIIDQQCGEESHKKKSLLGVVWFIMACVTKEYPRNLIKDLYLAMDLDACDREHKVFEYLCKKIYALRVRLKVRNSTIEFYDSNKKFAEIIGIVETCTSMRKYPNNNFAIHYR
ncbi:uncharacterized protein NEMAJ01_0975 [Nematocida major]|uniref:uncharacterized protein n=1 Tax=Nematocida major TaxID=1912982 RepID=UPI002007BE02|nr:uncharacterized protein NEMAJ01_0975 [Nematocida major]KAH9386079.1 hypothetical protein NEMAJ01_0975 [Nematocida major]